MSDVAAILRVLAELAPGAAAPIDDGLFDVGRGGGHDVAWLGAALRPTELFGPVGPERIPVPAGIEPRLLARLQAADALHREEELLRVGWLYLCGPPPTPSRARRVCMPLVQRAVRLVTVDGVAHLELLGDAEVTIGSGDLPYLGEAVDLVPAAERRVASGVVPPPMSAAELANDDRIHRWIDSTLAAAGLPPITGVLPVDVNMRSARASEGYAVVGCLGLHLVPQPKEGASEEALRGWAGVEGTARTAFAHVYGVASASASPPRPDAEVPTPLPLPLTVAQDEVVVRTRAEAVTVVSGAPGNGKSHTVCAVAIDAVARGGSVLLVTPSSHAADVLGELLARQPGPPPVLFGGGGGRRAMIAALEALAEHTASDADIDARLDDARRRWRDRVATERIVTEALERELRSGTVDRWTLQLPDLRRAVPALFEQGADLEEARRRLAAVRERSGWWRRRKLRKAIGGGSTVDVDVVADGIEAAAAVRAVVDVEAIGGTEIGAAWDLLLAAEDAERAAGGAYIDGLARASSRWRGEGRRVVAGLVAALPAGRATRRDKLAALDADALVRALPLWVGTLKDVEELLPARAGMFDLVIVDEAAQVDQFRAAGALLRADRAVVVGDPRQLRHVSFVADADVAAALERHGASALADRLDVRRQALFDLAAGAAPVTFLDEHFRSVPHLIDFSARRFYDDRVAVATRNPVNEAEDVIDVVPAPDVPGEVGVAVELVAGLVAAGQVGIGVITPFRAHADAIEAALLERFAPEVIEAHGLRTGTAHAAQGSEREHVVVCLGLAADDPPARWRFAEDPNLFNVLVTRGRRRLTVVTSLPEAAVPKGIVADYLRHARTPPPPPGTAAPSGTWIAELAAELERNGVAVRVGYPVGRWTVDICAGTGPTAVALDCAVHPDGPEAHVARHRTLRRAGWRVLDAFPSRWDDDAAAAAVEIAGELA